MKKEIFALTLILIIPVLFFIIAFKTLGDYGINWDEPYHFRRGQAFLQFYLTGQKNYNGMPKYPPLKGTADDPNFRDSEKNFEEVQNNPSLSDPSYRRSYYQNDSWNGEYFMNIENAFGHPALNGILASLTNYIFYQKLGILGDIESYHLFIILTVSSAIFFVAIFMWKKYGLVESLISSLALTTYPLLLGEQHFNIKDPVEMAFYTIALISFYLGLTKTSFRWLLTSVIFFGMALSVKFNVVFSIIPMAIWLIYYLSKNKLRTHFSRKIIYALLLSPVIILLILFFSYPTIWRAPIEQLSQLAKFYLGVGYSQSQPSNYYLFGFINFYPSLWITVTTPPITLLLFILSFFFIKKLLHKDSFFILLLSWFLVTLLRISLFKALSYNGVRLIMEYIPPMAMIAGISGGFIYKKIKSKKLKLIMILIVIAGFIPTICKLISIHPNENVYFNFLIGGLEGAKEKNLNSWGNSYGNAYFPAITWLNKNAMENAKLTLPVNLIGNIPRFKLRKDIALSNQYWSGPEHLGEYVVELTYDYPQMDWYSLSYLNTLMNPIYEVKVDGVTIAKVWKNDKEYVKNNYKKETETIIKVTKDLNKKILTINLPSVQKIMSVSISQPVSNCSAIKTGYVRTSVNNKTWTRELEDIATDQLKQAQLKGITPTFDFYFVAKETKTLIFEVDSSDTCLLQTDFAKVTTLKGN